MGVKRHQHVKLVLVLARRISAEGCLKSMPSLNTLRYDAATAVRLFAVREPLRHRLSNYVSVVILRTCQLRASSCIGLSCHLRRTRKLAHV